jgi:signal peptidase I
MGKQILDIVVLLLSIAAAPVVLVCIYDQLVLAPKRAKKPDGQPEPGPRYVEWSHKLLPFVLIGAAMQIGVPIVFGWIKQIAEPVSWLAPPVVLFCAIDSWIFAPRRLIAKGAVAIKDPPLVRALYFLLPIVVVAVIVRMITAETLDFSLVLLVLSVATGIVWAADRLFFKQKRELAMLKGVGGEMPMPEPGTVDYARSFFPVAFIVLVVRAFIFEPFRIPSDSMMPTLLDGDFIVVNKYAYGLRWPVINQKFFGSGSPKRGDVVVFRYPPNPNVNYIKRLVGLPGDRVQVHDDHLIINGETITLEDAGRFTDGCYIGMRLSTETLGEHNHQVLSCRTPYPLLDTNSNLVGSDGKAMSFPICNRKRTRELVGAWVCNESAADGTHDRNDYSRDEVIPAGHYLMIGDNRDNSEDGRVWGYVPDENLVGKATRIWFNLDLQRPQNAWINFGRIGNRIE